MLASYLLGPNVGSPKADMDFCVVGALGESQGETRRPDINSYQRWDQSELLPRGRHSVNNGLNAVISLL